MLKHRSFLGIWILFFFLEGTLGAEPLMIDSIALDDGRRLNLEQCLVYVLEHANSISSAKEKIRSHAHRLSAAKREYLPKLLADVNFGVDQRMEPVVFSSAGLELPVFWAPLNVEKKIAKSNLKVAHYELEALRNKLSTQVKEAYYHSLYARKLIKALQDSIFQLEKHEKVIDLHFHAGKALKVDVLKIQTQLNRERNKLEKTYADQRYYDSLLNNLLDLDLNETLHLEDVSFQPLALTLEECYPIAEAQNPAERIFTERTEKAKLEVARVKRSSLKNLRVFGKFQRQIASYVNSGDQDNFVFGINGNLGLWDWFQNRQYVKEKQSNYESEIKEIQDDRNQLKIELKRNYEELDIAEGEVATAVQMLTALEEEYRTQVVRFDFGAIRTDDLLATQSLLSKTKAEYEKAISERNTAKAKLYEMMGVSETSREEGRGLVHLSDQDFLNLVAKKSFHYFVHEYSKKTGLFLDAAGGGESSTAGTGFGLAALVIGSQRGWITKEKAEDHVLKVLQSLLAIQAKGGTQNGLFYHFMNPDTGRRASESEISNIDTALLMAGALTVREYFGGEVARKVDELYRNIRWEFLMAREESHANQFYLGWSPEEGYSKYYWNAYTDEALLIILLSLGSPVSEIPREVYQSFQRSKRQYNEREFYPSWSGGLFTYQYANIFYDFDSYVDPDGISWFDNGVQATRAQIEYLPTLKNQSKAFEEGLWGVSAGELADGHYNMMLGTTPNLSGKDQWGGILVPSAVAGAIRYTPRESVALLRKFYKDHPLLWGKYGFTSSIDVDKNWVSSKFYALDVGLTLLTLDNYQHGTVQRYFMQSPYVKSALEKAGFHKRQGKSSIPLKEKSLYQTAQLLEMEGRERAAYRAYKRFARLFPDSELIPMVSAKIQ